MTDPCLAAVCVNGTCGVAPANEGGSCDDGNACTQGDTCRSGACVGGSPVVCTALDQCHDIGVCDSATGVCSNPNTGDGTPCNDGNACSAVDTCQAGMCVGGAAVVCTSDNPCLAVTCDRTTGCVTTPKAQGASCADTDRCDGDEACDGAGGCVAGTPVTCAAPGPCQQAGVCDPATGECSYVDKANGTSCDTGNPCTADTCQAGACVAGAGTVTPTCRASDQCHDVGVCDPTTGQCTNPDKNNGTGCDDGNPCTTGDTCQAGVCVPGTGTGTCGAALGTPCGTGGECASGFCTDGVCCNTRDCTSTCESCNVAGRAGRCTSTCPGAGACMDPGRCSGRGGGTCGNPTPKADGTTCGDFGPSRCVEDRGACQAGVCQPVPKVTCEPINACREAGTCDETTGACLAGPLKPCPAIDQCHEAGVCDPATGICSTPNKANGTPCVNRQGDALNCNSCQAGICTPISDGTSCGRTSCESCRGGRCSEVLPVTGTTCSGPDTGECCLAGFCSSTRFCESCRRAGEACGGFRECCSRNCDVFVCKGNFEGDVCGEFGACIIDSNCCSNQRCQGGRCRNVS